MEKSRDFLTGVIFIGMLLVLGVFTVFLADIRFGPEYTLEIFFEDGVGGLEEGSEVRVDGLKGGEVDEIVRRPEEGGILVVVSFDGDPLIYEDAEFRVSPSSFLGGRVLLVTNPKERVARLFLDERQRGVVTDDPLIGAGKVLARVELAFSDENLKNLSQSLASIQSFAGKLDEKGQEILDNVEEASRSVKTLAPEFEEKGRKVLGDVSRAAEDLRGIASDLRSEDGLLAEISKDGELKKDVMDAVSDFREVARVARDMARELESGEGTLPKLLRDKEIYEGITAVVRDLKQASAELNPTRLRGTIASIEAAAANVQAATAKLRQSDNIVGLLLTDKKMADKLRRSVDSLNEFLESQRENAPLTAFATILLKAF